MDFFITSDSFEPTESLNRFSEQLVRFDSLSFYFERPAWIPANLTLSPIHAAAASAGLLAKPQAFLNRSAIYLIPQTLPKFHPHFDDAMKNILASDESDSVVVIIFNRDKVYWKNRLRRRLQAALGQHLVDRIMFVPSMSNTQFAGLLQASTVVLDPYPFGGGVTSLEAFSLCKPVVTFPGMQSVPRLTGGMYSHMGIDSLVASTAEDYVEISLRLRRNATWRAEVEQLICSRKPALFRDQATLLEWQSFLSQVGA